MKNLSLLLALTVGCTVFATSSSAQADPKLRSYWHAAHRSDRSSWHQPYYHTAWGRPVALVVPPTARTETHWGWGVAQSSITPIYQQFKRPYPGGESGEYGACWERLPGPVIPISLASITFAGRGNAWLNCRAPRDRPSPRSQRYPVGDSSQKGSPRIRCERRQDARRFPGLKKPPDVCGGIECAF